jgi:hypothetical protein
LATQRAAPKDGWCSRGGDYGITPLRTSVLRYFKRATGFRSRVRRHGQPKLGSRPARLATLAAALAVLSVALAPAAAEANRTRPTALVAYYPSDRLPLIVRSLNRAGFPSTSLVYFGNYSAQPRHGARIATSTSPGEIAGKRYRWAPILQMAESTLWDRRRVSRREAEKLATTGQNDLTGSMPSLARVLRGSERSRVRWGTELGRRFRDRFRARIRDGEPVAAWQFDEVRTEVAGSSGRRYRDFTRGIHFGLHEGRKPLGDPPMRGLVHMSHNAFPIARARLTGELRRFWARVNSLSARLVGEEYPYFRGRASRVAYDQAAGQRALRRGGGDRAALSRRYLVGLTPGYIVTRSLGGNVDRRPRDWVNRWRADYIRARAKMGVAGFGEFNFMPPNDRDSVIGDVIRALAVGVRRLG